VAFAEHGGADMGRMKRDRGAAKVTLFHQIGGGQKGEPDAGDRHFAHLVPGTQSSLVGRGGEFHRWSIGSVEAVADEIGPSDVEQVRNVRQGSSVSLDWAPPFRARL
jgi:hypothetical protein